MRSEPQQDGVSGATRISRRALVVGSLAAGAAALLNACGPAAPASKPSETKPAESKPAAPAAAPATSAPAAAQAKPAETAKPAEAAKPAVPAGAPAAAGTPKKGGEYILASLSDANSLEPHNDLTNVRIYVTGLVYDNLV